MIIATAGHVDHGKTALVKQLTGVDTDRLDAEKKRGLSIDLGFAYRAHPRHPDRVLGFIDVPGHQRFINTMISGISGIDLGMLVVAADDGVMPQTTEHLAVLSLLGISECVGIITKTDRVDDKRVQDVASETDALLGTFQETPARIFTVSNTSGDGVAALGNWLDERLLAHHEQAAEGLFRMTVDRVFSLKGVGLVVTGTVQAGSVHPDDTVRLLPDGRAVRVRGLHAQDREAGTARRGQRCALNLGGDVSKDDIRKGDWLVGMDSGAATQCFTARAGFLETPVTLRHRMQVKLYIGARHVAAKLGFPDPDQGLVQVFTQIPVSCCHGDRFLLRDYSEAFLLGGGRVLEPWAQKIPRLTPETRQYLAALDGDSFAGAVAEILLQAGRVIDFDRFRRAWNLGPDEARNKLSKAGILDQFEFIQDGHSTYALAARQWQDLLVAVADRVADWHRRHRDRPGLPLDDLEKETGVTLDARLVPALLGVLQKEGSEGRKVTVANGMVGVAGFGRELPEKTQKLWRHVEAILKKSGLEIPLISELEKQTGVKGRDMNFLLSSAVKSGWLIRISPRRVGLPATLQEIAGQVRLLSEEKPRFSVIDFRDRTGLGRNYVIEVLDFLDTVGFTRREGNERMVVDASVPEKVFN